MCGHTEIGLTGMPNPDCDMYRHRASALLTVVRSLAFDAMTPFFVTLFSVIAKFKKWVLADPQNSPNFANAFKMVMKFS